VTVRGYIGSQVVSGGQGVIGGDKSFPIQIGPLDAQAATSETEAQTTFTLQRDTGSGPVILSIMDGRPYPVWALSANGATWQGWGQPLTVTVGTSPVTVFIKARAGAYDREPGTDWAATLRLDDAGVLFHHDLVRSITDTRPSLMAERWGTRAHLVFATDATLANIQSMVIKRNGAQVAEWNGITCIGYVTGDTAGDTYTVQAKVSGVLSGQVLTGQTKAASVLTVGTATQTQVPLSWTTVAAVKFWRVIRRPKTTDIINEHLVAVLPAATLSFTEPVTLDGSWVYMIEACYGDNAFSRSAEVDVSIIQSNAIAPYERAYELRRVRMYDPGQAIDYILGDDFINNPMEAEVAWWEEEGLHVIRNSPALERWATGFRNLAVNRLQNSLVQSQLAQCRTSPFGWIQQPYWSTTPYARFDGSSGSSTDHATRWDWSLASNATITGAYAYFNVVSLDSPSCQLRFAYAVNGGTRTYINAFTTRQVTFDQVRKRIRVHGVVTVAGFQITVDADLYPGQAEISMTAQNVSASALAVLDLFVVDTFGHTASNIQAAWVTRATTGQFGRMVILEAKGQSVAVTNDSVRERFGVIQVGSSVTRPVAWVFPGYYPLSTAALASYKPNRTRDLIGGMNLNGRAVKDWAVYLEHNQWDTEAKAVFDGAVNTLYSNVAGLTFDVAERGCILFYYAAMAAVWPSDSTYTSRRDALVSWFKSQYPDSDPQMNGFARLGLIEAIRTIPSRASELTTEAQRWQNAVSPLGDDVYQDFTAKWVHVAGGVDMLSGIMKQQMTLVLRRAVWPTSTQLDFNFKKGATSHHITPGPEVTSEAHEVVSLAANRIRERLDGITPIYVGNGAAYDGMGSRQNGNWGGASMDVSGKLLTAQVDKDSQWYLGHWGKPYAVRIGTTALAEYTGTFDPTFGGPSFATQLGGNRKWHYNEALGVLTITLDEAALATITVDWNSPSNPPADFNTKRHLWKYPDPLTAKLYLRDSGTLDAANGTTPKTVTNTQTLCHQVFGVLYRITATGNQEIARSSVVSLPLNTNGALVLPMVIPEYEMDPEDGIGLAIMASGTIDAQLAWAQLAGAGYGRLNGGSTTLNLVGCYTKASYQTSVTIWVADPNGGMWNSTLNQRGYYSTVYQMVNTETASITYGSDGSPGYITLYPVTEARFSTIRKLIATMDGFPTLRRLVDGSVSFKAIRRLVESRVDVQAVRRLFNNQTPPDRAPFTMVDESPIHTAVEVQDTGYHTVKYDGPDYWVVEQ